MATLEMLRRYAVMEPDEDDGVLRMCLAAAAGWFDGAGVPEPAEPDALYDVGVYMLALHYHDNRDATADKAACTPFGVMSIRHQLAYPGSEDEPPAAPVSMALFQLYNPPRSGDDPEVRQLCLDAAISWFRHAGVAPPPRQPQLYELGVCMLASHYYDNRGVLADREAEMPYGVMSIRNQLCFGG